MSTVRLEGSELSSHSPAHSAGLLSSTQDPLLEEAPDEDDEEDVLEEDDAEEPEEPPELPEPEPPPLPPPPPELPPLEPPPPELLLAELPALDPLELAEPLEVLADPLALLLLLAQQPQPSMVNWLTRVVLY